MLIAHFTSTNMTPTTYAEVLRHLDAVGAGTPSGRLHHACYGDPAALGVTDIWDSPENFQKFGDLLMPILASLGIQISPPDVRPIHNVLRAPR